MSLNADRAQAIGWVVLVLSSVPLILPATLASDVYTENIRFLSYIVVGIMWLIGAILLVSAAFLDSMDRLHTQRASANAPT